VGATEWNGRPATQTHTHPGHWGRETGPADARTCRLPSCLTQPPPCDAGAGEPCTEPSRGDTGLAAKIEKFQGADGRTKGGLCSSQPIKSGWSGDATQLGRRQNR
jgi:hypothetical protein